MWDTGGCTECFQMLGAAEGLMLGTRMMLLIVYTAVSMNLSWRFAGSSS